ncbi:Kelch-like protein 18 [Sparganum proliferum]
MSFTSISRKRLDRRRTTLVSVVFCHLRADWRRRQEATSANFSQSAEPMRTARWGLAPTPFRGAILVAGGVDENGRILKTVEMFTPPDARSPLGQWTELAHMQEPRCRLTLLTSANAVFALGRGNATHH